MSKKQVVLVLLIVAVSAGCATNLEKTIREMGYTPIRPPSSNVNPGSVITILEKGKGGVSFWRTCTRESAVGDVAPVPSSGVDQKLRRKLEGSAKLSADYLDEVKGSLSGSYVRDIGLNLANVRFLEVVDNQVYEAVVDQKKRSPSCSQMIKLRESEGREVTLIKSVFQADAQYTVTFEKDLDLSLEAKGKLIEELIEGLLGNTSGKLKATGSNTIAGSGLTWGITDDRLLVHGIAAAGTVDVERIISVDSAVARVADDPQGVQ